MRRIIRRDKKVFILVITLFMMAFFPGWVSAAEWPTQNITIIVPYNPGGGFDLVTRVTAPFIEKYLPRKVGVVVKNVPGAGTRIGSRELVKAKPDGLTISIFDPVSVAVMQLGGQLEWLDIKKLSWLAQLDNLADLVIVGPKTGFKSPRDLKGKVVRFACADDATIFRSAVVARNLEATPIIVRYSGTGEGIMASLRGDLDALSLSWSSAMRQVKASEDKMIPLMVSSRVPGLNVPSAKEFGIEVDEIIMDHPHTMAAPPGLPPEIRHNWEDIFSKIFKDPEWGAKMEKLGYPPSPMIGKDKIDAQIEAIMKKMDKYKDIISMLGLK